MNTLSNKNTLKFISGLKDDDLRIIHADAIVTVCRAKIVVVTDDALKQELLELIDATTCVLKAIREKKSPDEITQHCIDLQAISLRIPNQLPEKNTLASTSLNIAQACLYVLGFSIAISLGAVFHAWYFAYLTLKLFLNCFVNAMSWIGIPAMTLGLMSFGIYRSQGGETKTIPELRADIQQFCDEVTQPGPNL